MHSNGFIDFISRKYADRKYLKKEEDSSPTPIELIHLSGAFKILLISNLIAILVFALELISKRIKVDFSLKTTRRILEKLTGVKSHNERK